MTINNCQHCGGTHYGSLKCPYLDPPALPEHVTPGGLRSRADMVRDRLNDAGSCARHLELAADFIDKLMAETARLNAALDSKRDARPLCHGDGNEFFRLYEAMCEGHVITKDDIKDFKNLVDDHADEVTTAAQQFDDGRSMTLVEVGGKELLAAVRAYDDAMIHDAVARALVKFRQKTSDRKKGTH